MKALLIVFLINISFAASAQNTSGDKSTFHTITRSEYSIAYPESWSVDTSKTFGADLMIRSPRVDSLDDFLENVNVFVQSLKGQGYTLGKMGQESEIQLKGLVNNLVILESTLDSSQNEPVYKLSYTGRQGKYDLKIIQRYYLRNEVGYAVTLTLIRQKADEYERVSEKIFGSFNIR